MKPTILILSVIGGLSGLLALMAWPAHGNPTRGVTAVMPTTSASVTVDVLPPDVATEKAYIEKMAADQKKAVGDMQHDEMKQYALWVMDDWTHGVASEPVASYDDIADDIASAVALHEDAVLLAGLGYWEGARYAAYVDGYSCNDPVWRASEEGRRLMRTWGDCDRGNAYSIWQIHPIVDRSSKLYAICNIEMVGPMGSRYNAARCALAIARSSVESTGTLSGYTGESPFEGAHPKADERLNFVRKAVAKHPWHVLTKE